MEYNHGKGVKHFSDADAAMRMKKEKWRTVSDMRVRRTDLCSNVRFCYYIISKCSLLVSFSQNLAHSYVQSEGIISTYYEAQPSRIIATQKWL